MLKNSRGVTLMALIITVGVISILTGTMVAKYSSFKETEKLLDMYTDIEYLQDKVQLYYDENNSLPVNDFNTVISNEYINRMSEQVKTNDSGYYYKINTELLDVDLNNGKSATDQTDIYIVNQYSHEIYYLKGVEVDNNSYYTIPEEISETSNSVFGSLTLSATSQSDSITVTVIPNALENVQGYKYRLDDGQWSLLQQEATYTFTNLQPRTIYKVSAMAIDEEGNSIYALNNMYSLKTKKSTNDN